ncbi:MAG: PAS domain S-box protein [Thermodesulfobacteriota bacterium]
MNDQEKTRDELIAELEDLRRRFAQQAALLKGANAPAHPEIPGAPVVAWPGRPPDAEQDLRKAHQELEQRVAVRTAELLRTNEQLSKQLAERRRTARALEESEERYRLLVQNSLSGIYVHVEGEIVYVNEKLASLLGYDASQMLGRSFWDFFLPEDLEQVRQCNVCTDLNRHAWPQLEVRMGCADGATKWVELLGSTIMYRGRPACMGNVIDVTERKLAQERLGRVLEDLENTVMERTADLTKTNEQLRDEIRLRTQAQQALQQSEALKRAILDSVPAHIALIDRDRQLVWANRTACLWMNAPVEEIVGLECHAVCGHRQETCPGCVVAKVFSTERSAQAVQTTDHGRIIEHIAEPLFDSAGVLVGVVSVGHDITDLKRTERALADALEGLRSSEERLSAIIKNASDAIVSVDRAGNVILWNDSAAETFGYSADEVIGKPFALLVPGELWEFGVYDTETDVPESCLWPQRVSRVAVGRRKNGTEFPAELSLAAWETRTEVFFTGIFRDITQRKRNEAVRLRNERITAIGELAGGVAHNFNNLLQIITGGCQVALADLDQGSLAEVQATLTEILESAMLGSETVRRLQDFARMREGEGRAEGKVFDLSVIVDQALEMSKPWWKTNPERTGIRVDLHRNLRPECFVEGQESELFEVVVNLIKNAAEAVQDGGTITVDTFPQEDRIWLRVQDTGIGIPPANMQKIFAPFWTTKGFHGTGMGLAVSLGIVRRHRGEISVESQEGKGTLFLVSLPQAQGVPEPEEFTGAVESWSGMRIIIIDDMEAVARMLKGGLARSGAEILVALSGKQGIELFSRERTDVVICDLAMPEMNGWQVGKALLDVCREKDIPKPVFILITGWGGEIDNPEQQEECGVDRVLEKPVHIPKLVDVIREVLEEQGVNGIAVSHKQ